MLHTIFNLKIHLSFFFSVFTILSVILVSNFFAYTHKIENINYILGFSIYIKFLLSKWFSIKGKWFSNTKFKINFELYLTGQNLNGKCNIQTVYSLHQNDSFKKKIFLWIFWKLQQSNYWKYVKESQFLTCTLLYFKPHIH